MSQPVADSGPVCVEVEVRNVDHPRPGHRFRDHQLLTSCITWAAVIAFVVLAIENWSLTVTSRTPSALPVAPLHRAVADDMIVADTPAVAGQAVQGRLQLRREAPRGPDLSVMAANASVGNADVPSDWGPVGGRRNACRCDGSRRCRGCSRRWMASGSPKGTPCHSRRRGARCPPPAAGASWCSPTGGWTVPLLVG